MNDLNDMPAVTIYHSFGPGDIFLIKLAAGPFLGKKTLDSGTETFYCGATIGCNTCHQGPSGSSIKNRPLSLLRREKQFKFNSPVRCF